MNIIEPSVVYFPQGNTELAAKEHVVLCASICYQSGEKKGEKAEKFYNALISSNHVSTLRHESCYYGITNWRVFIDNTNVFLKIYNKFKESSYINFLEKDSNLFISTNANFLLDHPELNEHLTPYKMTPGLFFIECPELMRFTMCCTSSIDITREFNRVSPNSISEESTRYCNYSKDKFSNKINIGDFIGWEPGSNWNGDMLQACSALLKYEDIDGILTSDQCFNAVFKFSEYMYMQLIKLGVKPEQARKVLPLATKSTVIYTYSVKEWESILQKRLLNLTGKAHPDAIRLAELIYAELQKLGYKFNENNELVYDIR